MSSPSEAISVKLDSRTKYFCDLAARLQNTTFTALVNSTLRAEIGKYEFDETALWAEHPADRLALIGNRLP
jgi:hypothetical protein